jgi:hypothetical protein
VLIKKTNACEPAQRITVAFNGSSFTPMYNGTPCLYMPGACENKPMFIGHYKEMGGINAFWDALINTIPEKKEAFNEGTQKYGEV